MGSVLGKVRRRVVKVAFHLHLLRTPDTHHINSTTIRNYPGFPSNILRSTMAAAAAAPASQQNNNEQAGQPTTHTARLLDLTRRITQRNQETNENNSDTTTTPTTRARSTTPTTQPPRKRAAPSDDTNGNQEQEAPTDNDSDPYDDRYNWTAVAETVARQAETHHHKGLDIQTDSRNTFSTLSSINRYSVLGEHPENDYNEETDRYHDGNPNDVEMEEEELDEWDNMSDSERSRALLQPNDTSHNNPSQNTMSEIQQITAFVQQNNSSQLPALEKYIGTITSFTTETDAQDAWEFAERLVQQKRPSNSPVAGPRPGHVDPHDNMGQRAE